MIGAPRRSAPMATRQTLPRRLSVATTLIFGGLCVLGSGATAATLQVSRDSELDPPEDTLTYRGEAGEANRLQVTRSRDILVLSDGGAATIAVSGDGSRCRQLSANMVTCAVSTVAEFDAKLGEGDDEALVAPSSRSVSVEGGAGADRLS